MSGELDEELVFRSLRASRLRQGILKQKLNQKSRWKPRTRKYVGILRPAVQSLSRIELSTLSYYYHQSKNLSQLFLVALKNATQIDVHAPL